MRHLPWLLAAPAALLLSWAAQGCGSSDSPAASPRSGEGGNATGAGGGGAASELPCDVAAVLETHCSSCHANPPSGGAPIAIQSYEDLTRASAVDPAQTVAQRSLARMKDAESPMPPGGTPPPGDVAVLEAWITAGMPKGECGAGGAGGGAPEPALVCTSNEHWTRGDDGSQRMHPGMACIDCHTQAGDEEGPAFDVAGTVYPTLREPDDCYGAAGATVEITDANGQVVTLATNAAGNFFFPGEHEAGSVVFPVRAKVIYEGREREMVREVDSGDCNTCHSTDGAEGAPGRIALP